MCDLIVTEIQICEIWKTIQFWWNEWEFVVNQWEMSQFCHHPHFWWNHFNVEFVQLQHFKFDPILHFQWKFIDFCPSTQSELSQICQMFQFCWNIIERFTPIHLRVCNWVSNPICVGRDVIPLHESERCWRNDASWEICDGSVLSCFVPIQLQHLKWRRLTHNWDQCVTLYLCPNKWEMKKRC
jgi:hypothetical protein